MRVSAGLGAIIHNNNVGPTDEGERPGRSAGISRHRCTGRWEGIASPTMPYLRLRNQTSGEPHEFERGEVRMGREPGLELVVSGTTGDVVSGTHARLVHRDGTWWLEDLGSRNGTYLDERRVTPAAPRRVAPGAVIGLGRRGPRFVVDAVLPRTIEDTTPEDLPSPAARDTADSVAGAAAGRTPEFRATVAGPRDVPPAPVADVRRRSFGGKGKTVFFQEMFAETHRRTARRVRWIVWSFVVLLAGATGTLYWFGERRVQEAIARQDQATDSIRRASRIEYERLRAELERARSGSAPAVVVESLRTALEEAGRRTTALESALGRAQASLEEQLAAGDELRRQAEAELARLRTDLARAAERQPSGAVLDSLRAAVAAAEARAGALESQLRAVKGVDLAAVAQANQAAVGLVAAYVGPDVFDASGFAITPSGYFVSNRHVLVRDGRRPDSVFVTMADQQVMRRADIAAVAAAGGPDLAILKIRSHSGVYVHRVDWSGTRVRQGEPAALIGFPAGFAAALDQSRTVRTSMSAGIFSKVTPETIQFDGFTVSGSSGSPIFNADGEVVAIHRAGLRDAVGMGFAEPASQLVPLLPPAARAELNLR